MINNQKKGKKKNRMTDIIIPTEKDIQTNKGLRIKSKAIGSDLSFLLGIEPNDYFNNTKIVPFLLSSTKRDAWLRSYQKYCIDTLMCGYDIDLNEKAKKYGIRPMTDKSIIPPSMEVKSYFNNEYGCTVIEYGFYPQSFVNPRTEADIIQQLDEMYKKKEGKTGNVYTFNQCPVYEPEGYGYTHDGIKFVPWKHFEYELNGNRYVRVKSKVDNQPLHLRNNKKYWIKVEPIEWLLDEENGKMITKQVLLSGISIMGKNKIYDGNFKQTQLYQYLNTYFAEEMKQNNHLCTQNKELLMSNFQKDFEKEIILPNETTYQDNRLEFYNKVFKYAKKYTERIKDNQEDQNKITMFAKNFVIQLSGNPELSLSDAFEIVKQKSNTEETQAQTQAQAQMQTQAYSDIRNFNPER